MLHILVVSAKGKGKGKAIPLQAYGAQRLLVG